MKTKSVMMLVSMLAGLGIANAEQTLTEISLPSTPLGSDTGLLLWNKLGSTNEVNNSEIGPNGTLNAGRFVDGPFGKGIELNMQEQMGVTFPPHIVPAPAGCIEFWAKLSGFPEAIRQPGGAWPQLVGTSVLNFGITFCSNNGAASGGVVQGVPGLGSSGTGLYGYWTYASALKTNTVTDWHHYALVWSGAGIPGVDNGQRRVISYIDGRMNTGHWIGTTGTQFTGLTNVIFGLLAHQGVPAGSVAYDNIKIWNFAKTNFSDRFNEDITPPVTLTVSFNSQGGSPVDSKVCAENTLYGVLPIPTRDGYTFDGWFKDEAYTLPVSADMSVSTESHLLYAKWTAAPTSGSGLLLWNRLGSTNEVNSSEVGPNGTLNAGRFVDGPFGKGIELNMQEQMGVTFPPQILPGPDGCIEFWAKMRDFPSAIRQPGGSWPGLIAACSQTGSQDFMLFYCSNDGAANGGICARVAGLGSSGTGMFGSWTYASALKTNAVADWHHYALVWASAGIPGVDNGQRKAAVYVNGKLNSGYWGGGTGSQLAIPTNGLFGLLSHQGTPAGSVAFDNIKIWNIAKTNFSDRFAENAGDLRRFLSVVEACGEAVPGNGVQMYTYGASVNASVPATVTDGGVRYICTGAIVEGNEFTQAGTTNAMMTLTNNATLTWQWRTEYLLQVETNGNGTVNAATGWHAAGNNVQLTPVPAVGWSFDGWAGETNGCVMEGSVLTVAMTQPRSISASFVLATALLTFNPQGGAVSPSTKSITFDTAYGELPMAERPDYLFKGWWTGVNGQGTQILASSVVVTAGDHTLYANWEKIPLLCKPVDETLFTTQGFYEGFLSDEGDFDNTPTMEVRGTVSLSVFGRADKLTVSAKALVQDKSLVFKNPSWSPEKVKGGNRVKLFATGGEILDLCVGQTRFWGTLSGGSLGDKTLAVDGMRNRFADRQDAGAQAILDTFRGYYTLALPAYGVLSLGEADAAPEGTGYLTITVGNQGHVNIGGVLADGTKFSKSSSLILFDECGPEACVPLFVSLYAQKGLMSGLLWFDPVKRTIVTDRDLSWFLRWEKPGSGMDGFSELLEACGGFYSTFDALSAHYRFSAGVNAVSYFHSGIPEKVQPVFPSEISVAADNRRLVITKGVAPLLANGAYNYAASENPSMATLSLREATGVFSGSFKMYYDYTAQNRLYHKALTVQYSGVLVMRRSEVFDDLPAGLGFYLVPDNNPALAPQSLKRSYPIELEAVK